jgi:hypothetical protein
MGCSFIFVRPPPSNHERLAYFDCESSVVAPAVDTTNAVVDGVLAGIAAANTQDYEGQPGLAATFGVTGAVYAASAIYGFVMTSKCSGAKALLAERVLKTNAERDQLLQARSSERAQPTGCQRDLDCKGTRVCANAVCVEPPAAQVAPAAAPASSGKPATGESAPEELLPEAAPPTSAFPAAPAPPSTPAPSAP